MTFISLNYKTKFNSPIRSKRNQKKRHQMMIWVSACSIRDFWLNESVWLDFYLFKIQGRFYCVLVLKSESMNYQSKELKKQELLPPVLKTPLRKANLTSDRRLTTLTGYRSWQSLLAAMYAPLILSLLLPLLPMTVLLNLATTWSLTTLFSVSKACRSTSGIVGGFGIVLSFLLE